MDQQNPTLAKILILDTGKFKQWKFRIQQYLQHEHYALWEVIECGDSYEAPQQESTTASASEGSVKKRKELLHLLLMTCKRGGMISDLDRMSLDDLYNHLKVYEPKVQKKSESNSQNMAFISSAKNSSGNEEVNAASISTASTQVSPAGPNVATAKIIIHRWRYVVSELIDELLKITPIGRRMKSLADKAILSGADNHPPMLEKDIMTSLADKAILSGADNHPPMLEKDMYDSWKSRMELYMLNRQHGRMILESVENEAIQADCDVKAPNIILQGLPPQVYALRECKLYDEFDKFAYKKRELLRDFYLRFSLLLNDMNIYNIKLEQFQVNKFLNTLPPEWSKFVTDYASQAQSSTPLSITYTSNDFQSSVNHNVYNPSSSIPQMEYAPAVHQQSEFSQPDTGLVVLVFQKGDDPIDSINHMMSFLTAVVTSRYPSTNNQLRTSSNPRQQATINNGRVTIQPIQGRQNSMIAGMSRQYTLGPSRTSGKQGVIVCYNCKGEGHMSKQCTKSKRKRDEAWFKDKVLLVQAQANGQVLHEEELEFLADPGIAKTQSTYSPALQDDLILSVIEQLKTQVVNCTKINQENKNVNEILTAELERYKNQKEESRNIDRELALEKQLEPKLYDGSVIQKTNSIVIHDSEETLMLKDLSRSKMLQKQKDPMMFEKKVNTKPVDYAALNQLSRDFETCFVPWTELLAEQAFWSQNSGNYKESNLSSSTTRVKVPKELPRVSMLASKSSPTDSICFGGGGTVVGGGDGDTNDGSDGEGDPDLLQDEDSKNDGGGEDDDVKSNGGDDNDGISNGSSG
nr:hypothetical protein [Tanacetum cinerariifolium]